MRFTAYRFDTRSRLVVSFLVIYSCAPQGLWEGAVIVPRLGPVLPLLALSPRLVGQISQNRPQTATYPRRGYWLWDRQILTTAAPCQHYTADHSETEHSLPEHLHTPPIFNRLPCAVGPLTTTSSTSQGNGPPQCVFQHVFHETKRYTCQFFVFHTR